MNRRNFAALLPADAHTAPNRHSLIFSTTNVGYLESLVATAYDPADGDRITAFRSGIEKHCSSAHT